MITRLETHVLPDCPVCGLNAWSNWWTGTRLRGCRVCNTVLNDRSASRAEEERRYETDRAAPAPDASTVAADYWRWVKRALLPRNGAGRPSILDIGCGHGAFLRAVRQEGGRLAGVELDPAGVESCRRQALPVVHGSIFDVGVPAGPWDVITMWDVLDHLERPAEALRLAAGELAARGVLVVRGRNARLHARFRAVYARMRGARLGLPDWSAVHRWGFAPDGYVALLRRAGLGEIRLHAGMPTLGDRYGTLGPRLCGHAVKGAIRLAGGAVHRASLRLLYPFPSVLITGRKLASPLETQTIEPGFPSGDEQAPLPVYW